ncbi:hypothetical protein ACHAWF_017789, partial [Thalassiosira exigua]
GGEGGGGGGGGTRTTAAAATFDLAGKDASTLTSAMSDAFSDPLPAGSASKITFVAGGGRGARNKYDPGAVRATTAGLREAGYVEDRGASAGAGCEGGRFKTQHDTGKNVYTVVVFPRTEEGEGSAAEDGGGGGGVSADDEEPLIPHDSPGYKIAICTLKTFQNLLAAQCPTHSEKRECLRCLDGLAQVERAIEEKMTRGHPLDGGEKAFYDDATDLREKCAHVQKEASRHVEEGRLAIAERDALVEANEGRIEHLTREKSTAAVAEKLKKALGRKRQLQSLTDGALSTSTSYPPPLRHEAQISSLRKKLLPLMRLEESSRGRLLTLAETRSLTEKEEIEDEILRLELASRGWFEEDDAFEARVSRSREKFEAKSSRSGRGGGGATARGAAGQGGGGGGSGATSKWILPGEKPKNAWGASSMGKGKLKGKGGAVFSAMMLDSSSEEEDEDDDDDSEEEGVERTSAPQVLSYAKTGKKQHPAASNVVASPAKEAAGKGQSLANNTGPDPVEATGRSSEGEDMSRSNAATKKGKKKKKKKGKSKKPAHEEDEEDIDAVMQAAAAPSEGVLSSAISAEDAPSTVTDSLRLFWRSFLLPFITAILSLMASLVTSMFAGNKGSKKGGKKKKRG